MCTGAGNEAQLISLFGIQTSCPQSSRKHCVFSQVMTVDTWWQSRSDLSEDLLSLAQDIMSSSCHQVTSSSYHQTSADLLTASCTWCLPLVTPFATCNVLVYQTVNFKVLNTNWNIIAYLMKCCNKMLLQSVQICWIQLNLRHPCKCSTEPLYFVITH